MNISFESWHEPSFYIKDQLPKIEFKIRDNFFIFFSSQLAKMVFDLKTSFFLKSTGTLKMNISFESWHEPSFYIKDQLPKIEFKIRDNFFIFFSSQLAKMVFDLKTSFF